MLNFFFQKNNIFFLFVILMFAFSCSGDNNEDSNKPQFYLKGTFNGGLQNYQYLSSFGQSLGGNMAILLLSLEYNISSYNGPYPGIYLYIDPNTPGNQLTTGIYNEENSNIVFEYRKEQNNWYTASKYAVKDFKIIVSQFDSKTIKGTFSGTLQNNDGETILVENGEFYGYSE